MKIEKIENLEGILKKNVAEGRRVVIAVHPTGIVEEALYEEYGNYDKYVSNLNQFLKNEKLFVIYLIDEIKFDTFEKDFHPKEPYILLKTNKYSDQLSDFKSSKFYSILEKIDEPVYIVGKFLWGKWHVAMTHINELPKVLKKHGYKKASVKVSNWLHPPAGTREELEESEVLDFLKSINITDDIIQNCFDGKLYVVYKDTCVPCLMKDLKGKVKTKLVRECCFPLKDSPK